MRSTLWMVGPWAIGLGVAGCGGSTGGSVPADAAGIVETTDAGLQAAQGSASIHFQVDLSAAAGKMCAAGQHWADAPTTYDSTLRTTGTARSSDIVVDGEKSRQFSCAVIPSGGMFQVEGQISVPAFDKDMKPLPIPTQIRLTTTIGKGESGAIGSLSVSDNDTGGAVYQSSSCIFSVQSDSSMNTRLAIDPGKAWGSVNCPSFDDPSSPASACAVDTGYFILENCRQK